MAIPWMQIVKWMPSIVQVSRELVGSIQRSPPIDANNASQAELAQRIAQLEDNERRQAELINQMAEQLSQFSQVLLIMRQRQLWLAIAAGAATIVAIVALVLAVR
jgi:primosomal protein N''